MAVDRFVTKCKAHLLNWNRQARVMLSSPQNLPIWCQRIVLHANRMHYNLIKTKDEWMDGKRSRENMASVAFVVTQKNKQRLGELGYPTDRIRSLSPEEVQRIIASQIDFEQYHLVRQQQQQQQTTGKAQESPPPPVDVKAASSSSSSLTLIKLEHSDVKNKLTASEHFQQSKNPMAAKALKALPFVALSTWSGLVYYKRTLRIPEMKTFLQGSMDDMIMDSLDTGDIVLFNRKCAWMQPPGALVCALSKKIRNTRYDHWGVIIVNRTGQRYVLEHTYAGVKCRPYSARILCSYAHEITAIPLKCKRTNRMRREAQAFAQEYQAAHSIETLYALLWKAVQTPATKQSLHNADGTLLHALYERLGIEHAHVFLEIPEQWPSSSSVLGDPIPIRLL